MPLVARFGVSVPSCLRISLAKLAAPVPHRLIGEADTTLGHQLLDITIAEREAVVRPHAVADNFSREPMTLVQMGGKWWGSYGKYATAG